MLKAYMKRKAHRKSKTRPNVSFDKIHFNRAACNAVLAFHEHISWLAKTENTSRILEIRRVSHSNCWLHWMSFSSLPNFVEPSNGVRAKFMFTGTLGNWNKVTRRRKCLFSNTFEPTRDHEVHRFEPVSVRWSNPDKEIGRFSISINAGFKFAKRNKTDGTLHDFHDLASIHRRVGSLARLSTQRHIHFKGWEASGWIRE